MKNFNLKRHLERNHPIVYKGVDDQDKQNKSARSKNQYEKNSRNSRKTMAKFFFKRKFTISMTKDKFKQHVIEMVIENGIPLTFFSLKGFLVLNGELAGKLGLSLERHDIIKTVITAAVNVVVVVGYPTPSKGWGHGGRPWSPRSRATPRVWTRGRREIESRQRVSGAKSP